MKFKNLCVVVLLVGFAACCSLSAHPTPTSCCGDCNKDGTVQTEELEICVDQYHKTLDIMDTCDACDCDDNGSVKINDIVAISNNVNQGCP